jgi:hypothetical protein
MVMWLSIPSSTRLFAPLRVMSKRRRFLDHGRIRLFIADNSEGKRRETPWFGLPRAELRPFDGTSNGRIFLKSHFSEEITTGSV